MPWGAVPVPSSTGALLACATSVAVRVPATATELLPYAVSNADDNASSCEAPA
jgi:hypothetical protein